MDRRRSLWHADGPARDVSELSQNEQPSEKNMSTLTSAPERVPGEAWYIDLRTDLPTLNQRGPS
jgi:hypothetical protein